MAVLVKALGAPIRPGLPAFVDPARADSRDTAARVVLVEVADGVALVDRDGDRRFTRRLDTVLENIRIVVELGVVGAKRHRRQARHR